MKFTPGPILLLGAPGVGKGTQAKELMSRLGNSPDLDRRSAARQRQPGTALGKQAKEIMDRGELVSDDLVNQMVAERLKEPDTARRLYSGRISRARWGRPNGWTGIWQRIRTRCR